MVSSWVSSSNLAAIFHRSEELWWKNIHGLILALLFLLIWQSARLLARRFRAVVATDVKTTVSLEGNSKTRITDIISDVHLRNLINTLDGELDKKEKWDDVIDKRNNLLSYNAKCCKPEEGPLKYLSVTIFENCSTELLRDFLMDSEYRKQWDKTLVEHEQLQLDESSGTEIGRTIKKFPFLTPREYVLAWRVWEGKEKTFYCFIKVCITKFHANLCK
ncbi:hypothetical protein HHK36_026197 [Tetracentron sinense]|uniref:START domain-containing protein n=1 Tax=Tetracentron sinense TaxID=13715 RepID=A0A834YJH4_TETSI|nr:hypothetical protein HHK36_026197 [Tetracentron sinense]